jgi:hypothetical protein
MSRPLPFAIPTHYIRRLLGTVVLILLSVVAAQGDVPSRSEATPAAGCYCPCHEAATRRGCTKMCDARKNTIRWLAVSCMKPRFQPRNDKSGTGPHLHHPDRAEHAQLLP